MPWLTRSKLMLLVAVPVLSACATREPPTYNTPPGDPECSSNKGLEVGETCRLRIAADQRAVPLPLPLVTGERYRINLSAGQRWSDAGRPAVDPLQGDNGEGNLFMRAFAGFKRLPIDPYMVLGMSVTSHDSSRVVRVSPQGHVLDVLQPLRVSFFANDVPFLHHNNSGSVWLTVQRQPPQ